MAKPGSFQGGDPAVEAALNQMEQDVDKLKKDVVTLAKILQARRSPFIFATMENGFLSYFVIDAQRTDDPNAI